MSAAENKRSVIVGIFVFLAIVIFVVGVFILAGQQKRFIRTINLRAVFDDVSGLRPGNNVWFSGVKVGTVRGITFVGNSQVEITMNIQADAQQYIREDAIARISSESFIGNRNIVIEGGTPQASPVEDGDRIQAINPLDTDDLMETLQRNNENLVAITNDFKQLSSRIVRGEGMVGTLLTDTTLAENFQEIVAGLQRTTANTVQMSRELNRFTSKLNTADGLVNELLTDTVVFDQLQTAVQQLQQTTSAATEMTNQLRSATTKLNQPDNAVGLLLNDEEFATRLRGTIQNLEAGTDKFDENMEALQHNFLLRGFFRRRAKQEAKQANQNQQNQP